MYLEYDGAIMLYCPSRFTFPTVVVALVCFLVVGSDDAAEVA